MQKRFVSILASILIPAAIAACKTSPEASLKNDESFADVSDATLDQKIGELSEVDRRGAQTSTRLGADVASLAQEQGGGTTGGGAAPIANPEASTPPAGEDIDTLTPLGFGLSEPEAYGDGLPLTNADLTVFEADREAAVAAIAEADTVEGEIEPSIGLALGADDAEVFARRGALKQRANAASSTLGDKLGTLRSDLAKLKQEKARRQGDAQAQGAQGQRREGPAKPKDQGGACVFLKDSVVHICALNYSAVTCKNDPAWGTTEARWLAGKQDCRALFGADLGKGNAAGGGAVSSCFCGPAQGGCGVVHGGSTILAKIQGNASQCASLCSKEPSLIKALQDQRCR